jgi:hypothetical protein
MAPILQGLHEPVAVPNNGALVAGVPPVDAPELDALLPPPKIFDVPEGFAAAPPRLPNENPPLAGVVEPDVIPPNRGLLAAGVALPNKLDDPALDVAVPPPPKSPPPGVLEGVFKVLTAPPKRDGPPPAPEPGPNKGLAGVLSPPPGFEKLKAIVLGWVGCMAIALNGEDGRSAGVELFGSAQLTRLLEQ